MTGYKLNIEWPENLLAYKERIEASIKPHIRINVEANSVTLPWQSNFGGKPYLLKGNEVPKDALGNPMFLLAQVNFSEVPHIELMPTEGILQFFISSGPETLYGIDFDNQIQQTNFKVIYHPNVETDLQKLETNFSKPVSFEGTPLEKAYSILFEPSYGPVQEVDYRFESLLNVNEDELDDDFYDAYDELFGDGGHKIGGYPIFTQWDPRAFSEIGGKPSGYEEFKILLFQMDSDFEENIMWGDVGVANFFICEEDLKRRDFSKVLYNWDCS